MRRRPIHATFTNNIEMAIISLPVTELLIKRFSDDHIFFSNKEDKSRLRPGHILRFTDDAVVEPYIAFNAGATLCNMGSFSYSNSAVPLGLQIGRYCSIAPGLQVVGGRHPIEALSTSSFTYDRNFSIFRSFCDNTGGNPPQPVPRNTKPMPVIEHDVWIGSQVMLSRGIKLSIGCVVATNSVVTKSVPPYAIVGGNPARLIRYRFPPDIITALLESQWWTYKFTDFSGLDVSSPEAFLQRFDSRKLEPYKPRLINLAEFA